MIKIDGRTYRDAGDLAHAYKLPYAKTVRILLQHGDFDKPEIIKLLKEGLKHEPPIMINGVHYSSIEDAAKQHNMTVTQLKLNLQNFGDKTDLVFAVKNSVRTLDSVHPLVINNIKFNSLFDLLRQSGLSKHQFLMNLREFGDKSSKIWLMRNNLSRFKYALGDQIFRSISQMLTVYDVPKMHYEKSVEKFGQIPDALFKTPSGLERFSEGYTVHQYMPFYLRNEFNEYVKNLENAQDEGEAYVRMINGAKYVNTKKIFEFYSKAGVFK